MTCIYPSDYAPSATTCCIRAQSCCTSAHLSSLIKGMYLGKLTSKLGGMEKIRNSGYANTFKDRTGSQIGTNPYPEALALYLAEIDGPRWHLNLSPRY
jgi:hypothetical protein